MKFEFDEKYKKIGIHVTIFSVIILAIVFGFLNMSYIYEKISSFMSNMMKILSPILLGVVFAYLLDGLVTFIDTKINKGNKNRLLATIITYIGLIVFLVFIGYLISTSLTGGSTENTFDIIIKSMQDFISNFNNIANQVKDNLDKIGIIYGEEKIDKVINSITVLVQNFGNELIISFRKLGTYVINIFMGLFISFYFLMDKDIILKSLSDFLDAFLKAKTTRKIRSFGREVNWVVSGYIRGQLLDVLIMGVLISIVLILLKIDYAIVIGILSGFANLIPMVGSIVATILAVLVALAGGSVSKAVYALIILIILQQIDGNIITPKVVGKNVNLHPLLVLLSIFIFGSLYGILGMIIAVPTTALIKHFLKREMDRRLAKKGLKSEVVNTEEYNKEN